MAFSPEDRPTAAQVATALHQMGATLHGPDLRTWSRQVVRPVQQSTAVVPGPGEPSDTDSEILTLPDQYVVPL